MIFITGGISQGKRTFAAKTLGITGFTSGASAAPGQVLSAECVTDYQLFVRRLMNTGTDPEDFTKRLCAEGKIKAVIMNEIGCGIVPADREERLWRETAGRCGCILAANAGAVVRTVCGIPAVIKGELP